MTFRPFSAILSTLILLAGMGSARSEVNVVASIKPIHALAAGIMEGVSKPALLLDRGGSPHTYSLRPSQAKLLQSADLVFWVGPGLEAFLEKPLSAITSKSNSIMLMDLEGLHQVDYRDLNLDHEEDEEHGKHDEHDEEEDHHGHGPNDHDPHVWLDPQNAIVMVRHMLAELISRDPDNADAYAKNASRVVLELTELNTELETAMRPFSKSRFIVFHDAYAHFEYRYGLQATGSLSENVEVSPSAKRLAHIRDLISESSVSCVFSEPQFDPRYMRVAAEDAQVHVGVLDPIGKNLEPGPKLYGSLMRQLAQTMSQCFRGS